MRNAPWLGIASWSLMMAVMCGFGLLLIVLAGWPAVIPGLVFSAFAGGMALWGWHSLRARTRSTESEPEVLPVPVLVDDTLTIRKTPALGLIPIFLFSFFGWGAVSVCVAAAFGLISGEGSVLAGLVISGLFVLFAHSALMEHAVTVKLDLHNRTWQVRKGVWPIRTFERGDLSAASHVAVAREFRSDEGADYEVLVARLAWRDGWQAPLVLSERPNSVDSLRYGGQSLTMDYRHAMMRWASRLAGVLNLPLADESKYGPSDDSPGSILLG
jgi:hypothetical protein